MRTSGSSNPKKKLSKKEVAKLVKSSSRKHKLPPNKVEEPKKGYKRNKKIDEEAE